MRTFSSGDKIRNHHHQRAATNTIANAITMTKTTIITIFVITFTP